MNRGYDIYNSVLVAYRVVFDGLSAIRTESGRMNQLGSDCGPELMYVEVGALCLMKTLQDIRRYRDIHIIAPHIYYIAGSLGSRVTRHQGADLIQEGIASSQSRPLGSPAALFEDVLQSPEECKRLQKEMHRACIALEPFLSDDYVEDDDKCPESTVPYDHLFYPSANRLFQAISCECKSDREIRLRLGMFRSSKPPHNDRSLDILFRGKDKVDKLWLALRLHCPVRCIRPASPEDESCNQVPVRKRVAFEEPYRSDDDEESEAVEEEDDWRAAEPASCDCICSHSEQTASIFRHFLQHVELDETRRWQIHQRIMDSPLEHMSQEYCLSDLLTEMNWTDVNKIVLAMQLAHALAYHHDGGWFSGWWQQSNICFFRCGSRISCKPWLKVSPDHVQSKTERFSGHPFPQLLELGTVLLELQLGQSLDHFLGEKPAETAAEKLSYASRAFFGKLEGGNSMLSRDYRRAIEFCLKPNKAVKESGKLREAIYNHVVLPLEKMTYEFGLDEKALEDLDLGLIQRAAYPRAATVEPRQSAPETNYTATTESVATSKIQVLIQQRMEMSTTIELEEGFELFGDEEELQSDKDRARASDDWIKKIKKIFQDRIGKTSKSPSSRRVKVALLDTGIDLNHAYFSDEYPSGRIKSVRSWVDGHEGSEKQDCGDESGHGTFIASLLLSLVPNIDLYVAKISKSRTFQKGTSMNVANALYYAREIWDVDIITMSFGFPRAFMDIEQEIAGATQKDILVFAAASNDGRNSSRMYPARNRSVFAIHSTNSKGIKSDFNPPPSTDQNLSILGEYVESAWRTSEGSNGCTRRLSGTSFATPIAVCLSAFLLAYIPILIPDHEMLFHKIQSYDGMHNVLQAIVTVDNVDPGSRYQYLAVEKFFNPYENTMTAVGETLRKALRG